MCARAKHTMTTIFYDPNGEFNDNNPVKWDRKVWMDKKLQKTFNPTEFMTTDTRSSNFKYGIFIFGGYSAASESALSDLWLLQPNTQSNSSIIIDKQDPNSFYKDRASAYLVGYNVHLLAFNITKYAKGKAPAARYAHQALSIRNGKYLVISGGRNNGLYKSMGNIAFNDICLFNTQTFEWETLAMYG